MLLYRQPDAALRSRINNQSEKSEDNPMEGKLLDLTFDSSGDTSWLRCQD